jgi:hypothetical protein
MLNPACQEYTRPDIISTKLPVRPEPHIMTDTEIDKVISAFECVGDHRHGWDTLFRDPNTRKFWELVYPSDGSTRELKPIKAHDARMRYSAAFSAKQSEIHDYWLDGETLASVTFVADYWQLHFGNSMISPLTRVEVRVADVVVRDGDDQFRNRLCEQIGKVVERFELKQSIGCTIMFEDRSSIFISLKQSDYRGPEGLMISGAGHLLMVE